jgi:hypothetical protein
LGDQPNPRGLSDPAASELASSYAEATVVVALPSLEIRPNGQTITLTWPATAGDFALQTMSDGAWPATAWTNVAGQLQTNSGTISITVPVSGEASFYRLNRP